LVIPESGDFCRRPEPPASVTRGSPSCRSAATTLPIRNS